MRTLIGLFVLAAVASAGEAEDKRLNEAATVLTEIMGTGDNAIPQNLIEKAACAVIVPGMKKGGFIVGAKYGRGFATCRKATSRSSACRCCRRGWSSSTSTWWCGSAAGRGEGGSDLGRDAISGENRRGGVRRRFEFPIVGG